MAFQATKTTDGRSTHRDGHVMGDFNKRTSQGDGRRKRGSYGSKKRYRGQGKR